MRHALAFIAGVAAAYVLSATFYTQQILAKQAMIGAAYTPAQQFQTYAMNFLGLAPSFGVVLAIALLIGFVIAAGVKRVLAPLAPVAYPIAGGAAVFAALQLIENFVGGGQVGAIGGARDALGLGLQVVAGVVGGAVFALARPKPARKNSQ